jgi:hypothetical protein
MSGIAGALSCTLVKHQTLSSATMTSSLPFEILSIIARYVAAQGGKLTPYAMVNRDWQVAFEEEIYSSLVVLSPSDVTTVVVGTGTGLEPCKKHGLTLQRLDALVTGPESWKRDRKAAIKRILYKVAVPHWLTEEIMRDDDDDGEEYTYDNAFRRENDRAFSEGVRSLFDYLSHWTDKARPISLGIVLQAERVYTSDEDAEPGVVFGPETEEDELIAPYRASFIRDCQLPIVNCISSLDLPEAWLPASMGRENQLSPGAALKIASACGGDALLRVQIDGAYLIPRVDTAVSAERRATTAENLSRLPPSVRRLDIQWCAYGSVVEVPSAPSPLPAVHLQPDALSAALHNVSLQLKELHIDELDVLPEFFCPTGIGLPLGQNWAHLEILKFTSLPFYTPFGHVLWYDDGFSLNNIHVQSYFDEFYTNAGLAVQRMPKLSLLSIGFHSLEQELRFHRSEEGRRGLNVHLGGSYRFSREVLHAWKVHKAQIHRIYRTGLMASWKTWPPS